MEVEIYWGSSRCRTRKKVQQLVSEPSILGGERRLESRQSDAGITENRWELELQQSDSRWKLESQQSDTRWEKNMQRLRNIISSKPGGEVAAVDKESSRVEEEDQQVEIRWQQLEARWEEIAKFQREQEAQWRRTDAKFDALKKLILDLSLPSKGRSMATTDANSGSCCSTDFEHLECNLSPMQKTELELPHVEGPRSYSLESRENGWDVQRSTAATNDGFESHVREGDVRLDPSEFMPLPHKLKSTKVSDINYESYFLNFSHNSMSKPSKIVDYGLIEQHSGVVVEQHSGVVENALAFTRKELGNCWKFSLHSYVDAKDVERLDHGQVKGIDLELEQYVADFSEYKTFSQANKLKEAECLPSARQIATVRELAVTLNVVRNLMRLPVRFPKPLVKMKFMAQYGEEMGGEGNVQWAPANTGEELSDEMFEKMILDGGVVVDGKGELLEENRQRHVVVTDLQKSLVELHQVFLDMAVMVDAQADNLNNIEENVVRAAKDVRGGTKELDHANRMKRKRTCACWIGVVVLVFVLVCLIAIFF